MPTGASVFIKGSNSTPNIDGTYTATNVNSTTFSIPVTVSVAGTNGYVTWGHFRNRVYWALLMNPTVKDATTNYLQMGLVPGTAKGDTAGGYSPVDWYIRASDAATETTDATDLSGYTPYIVACGC